MDRLICSGYHLCMNMISQTILRYNVFCYKESIIDNIRTRYGGFRTAWIIGGYAKKS